MPSLTPGALPTVAPGSACPACGQAVPVGDRYCSWCGTLQPAGAAGTAEAVPDSAPRRRTGWRGRTRWIVAGAAALVVVVGIAFSAGPAWNTFRNADPGRVVGAYLQALGDRDVNRARAMLASGAIPALGRNANNSQRDILAAAALRNPGYTPPKRVQVRVLRSRGGTATVAATFDLPGGQQTIQLQLARDGGALSRWEITNGLLPMTLPSYDGGAEISLVVAGVPVSGESPALAHVFPGAYRVSLRQKPFVDTPAPLTVRAGTSAPAHFELRPQPGVQERIETGVRAFLDECAKEHGLLGSQCPFGASLAVDAALGVQWRVTEYPAVNLVVGGDGTVVMKPASGRILATGQMNTPPNTPFTRELTFQLSGDIVAGIDGKAAIKPAF